MKHIIIVANTKSDLALATAEKISSPMLVDHYNFPINDGDVLCWLPAIKDQVDRDVFQLVARLDQAAGKVGRLVMWSPAGTADDATAEQLSSWWGPNWRGVIGSYLYATKMIDELEYPYTIIRSLPYTKSGPAGMVYPEGQQMVGDAVSLDAVAQFLADACHDSSGMSKSVGVGAKI